MACLHPLCLQLLAQRQMSPPQSPPQCTCEGGNVIIEPTLHIRWRGSALTRENCQILIRQTAHPAAAAKAVYNKLAKVISCENAHPCSSSCVRHLHDFELDISFPAVVQNALVGLSVGCAVMGGLQIFRPPLRWPPQIEFVGLAHSHLYLYLLG